MNQNTGPIQYPMNPQQTSPQPVTPGNVVPKTPHSIAPHRVIEMPSLIGPTAGHAQTAPVFTSVVKKKDNTFYAAVIVFVCLIVAMSGYLLLAISNQSKPNNIVNNIPVNNIPVSDETVIPTFIEKSFALNKKIIWNVTYPETFFADESEIEAGSVTLSGEYLDNNIKVSMTFPTFKNYHTTTPLYLSDWLEAEKALVDDVDEAEIRTELTTIEGLEAAVVYNYPEIVQETPNRIFGLEDTIVVYIWKNENNNPRRVIFEMDDYNEAFLSDFVQDFIAEMTFQ